MARTASTQQRSPKDMPLSGPLVARQCVLAGYNASSSFILMEALWLFLVNRGQQEFHIIIYDDLGVKSRSNILRISRDCLLQFLIDDVHKGNGYDQETPQSQTTGWKHEEETHNTNSRTTARTQLKQSALPPALSSSELIHIWHNEPWADPEGGRGSEPP